MGNNILSQIIAFPKQLRMGAQIIARFGVEKGRSIVLWERVKMVAICLVFVKLVNGRIGKVSFPKRIHFDVMGVS